MWLHIVAIAAVAIVFLVRLALTLGNRPSKSRH